MTKVSIIVPVYNVEKYLEQCLNSLVEQTFGNIEILIVDDGSTDSSLSICQDYQKLYKNISVYHKENGGLSSARNYGLERAKGDWILFVDSDDYLSLDAVELLMQTAEQSDVTDVDMIIGDYQKEYEGAEKVQWIRDAVQSDKITGKEYLRQSLKAQIIFIPVWTKMYRRQFLLEHTLAFPEGLLHEDEYFTPLAFLQADKVLRTNIHFYAYLIREGSIMTSKKQLNNVKSINTIVHYLAPEFDNLEEELRRLLQDHLATVYYHALKKITYSEAVENRVLDKKLLRKCSHNLKNKIRYAALNISYDLLKRF